MAKKRKNHPRQPSSAKPSSWLSFGNSGSNLRQTYTNAEVATGALDGYCVLNSISDSVIGDERRFVGIVRSDRKCVQQIDVPFAPEEYTIRLYVHNNSRFGTNFCTVNTSVSFDLSEGFAKEHTITGHIFAQNTLYGEYWSQVKFVSQKPFRLEYVLGSALLENNGIGKNGGRQLRDEIAAGERTTIGYSAMNGEIPGGYQYASYVTVRIRAIPEGSTCRPLADYTVVQKVRLSEDGTPWHKAISAQVGDKIDLQLYYQNTSPTDQTNVMVRARLPRGLRYLPGTTKLYNAKYNGGTLSDGIDVDGVNIGNYTPNSDAYVRFTAEVTDDGLIDGPHHLDSQVQVGIGLITIHDECTVTIKKTTD